MNEWVVLLTTCLNPDNKNNLNEIRFRMELYNYQIKKWLNETNMRIVVVESTGYSFPDIIHDRLTVVNLKFDKKYNSSSQYEARSIIYAIDQIKDMDFYIKCTHILKVTGRYFLQNIENVLNNSEQDLDLYLQYWRHDGNKWQNTEYFGIRKELLLPMVQPILDNGLIEHCFFEFSLNKKYCFIGRFPNNIPRGGDRYLYTEL
jgi:hypothetical protein